MQPFVLTRKGLLDNNDVRADDLETLQNIIRRNTPPECEAGIATLTRQTIDKAVKYLNGADIAELVWPDGTVTVWGYNEYTVAKGIRALLKERQPA